MKDYFARMIQYAGWANRRCMEALRATSAAHAEATPLLAHLLAAEHVWLARLQQEAPRVAVWPALNLDQCAELAAENQTGYGLGCVKSAKQNGEPLRKFRSG